MSEADHERLPFIDAQAIAVHAPAQHAWEATAQVMRGWAEQPLPPPLRALVPRAARLMRCSDPDSAGPGTGLPETMLGFHVTRADQPTLIALEGEHRFSRYALTFHIQSLGAAECVLGAHTRAVFPGRTGRGYRAAVIGSGAHVLVVRRMLTRARRLAEASMR